MLPPLVKCSPSAGWTAWFVVHASAHRRFDEDEDDDEDEEREAEEEEGEEEDVR